MPRISDHQSHADDTSHTLSSYIPHIGMRKAKSLLAVFMGFWLWQCVRLIFPSLEIHPVFIYVYGLIEIRETSEKTVDFGWARIKATFIALGVGLPLLFLSEFLKAKFALSWRHTALELVLLLFGVLLTLLIAEKAGCTFSCGLAAAFFIILFASYTTDEMIVYAVLRAVQTVAGVFVAWVINVLWFPYPPKPRGLKDSGERNSEGNDNTKQP